MQQKTVVKPSLAKPGRVSVTACRYNADGGLIAAGLMDGTIQLWSVGGKFGVSAAVGQVLPPKQQFVEKQQWTYVSRPNQLVRNAHEPTTEITSIAFSQDGYSLASRGMDDTLKLWDLRKFTQPIHVIDGLPTHHATTQCIFSPDERLVVTGVAAGSKGQEGGAVVFVDRQTLQVVRRLAMPSNVASLHWHHRLNQLFVGIGDRKEGATHVLYDTTFSEKGILGAVARAPRKRSEFDFQAPLIIKTPHALPMFREDMGKKRQREKDLKDPIKSRRPDPGMALGPGREGRLGATGGTLLTQHLLKTKGKLVGVAQEQDPREAILRHAGKASEEFSGYTAAYKKTQPKPIYAQEEEEEQEPGQ